MIRAPDLHSVLWLLDLSVKGEDPVAFVRQFAPEVWGFLSCQDRGIMCLPDAHPYLVDILMI